MSPRSALFQDYSKALRKEFGGRIAEREGMKRHTTFKIGGMAALMVWPQDLADLVAARELASSMDAPVKVLGEGSNLLVGDGGLDQLVLNLIECFQQVEVGAVGDAGMRTVRLGAGVKLIKAVKEAQLLGLGGMEWAAGIPGSTGGATIMNAGAMGTCMADVIEWVEWHRLEAGVERIERADLEFSYRSLVRPPDAVVVACGVRLTEDDPRAIRERIVSGLKHRRQTQPLSYPSAGSVFKNPPDDFAGRLIEAVGLKGERVGDAQISDVHANFIVNRGRARSRDVLSLIDTARERVAKDAGIELELEIELLGEELP